MSTTSLIVEVVAIGAVGLLAVVLLTTGLVDPITVQQLIRFESLRDLSIPLAIPALAITYCFGWIINFVSEGLFKKVFKEEQQRDKVFQKKAKYEEALNRFLQRGSSDLVQDVLFNRHITRLSRAGVINFGLLGIAFFVYWLRGWKNGYIPALIFAVFAAISYMQADARYRDHYERLHRISDMLQRESPRVTERAKSVSAH